MNTDLIKRINPVLLRDYLEKCGWKKLKNGMFMSPDGEIYFVPDSLEGDLDMMSVESVLTGLQRLQSTPSLSDLVDRILGAKEDLVLFGIEIKDVEAGKLPLSLAGAFYESIRRFFGTVLLQSLDVYQLEDTKRNQRSNYLKSVKISRTQPGSYVIALHLPIDTIPTPMGRSVSTVLDKAMEGLAEAVGSNSSKPLLSSRWSGEMCDSFIAFSELKDVTAVKILLFPDQYWNMPSPLSRSTYIFDFVAGPAVDLLQEAARVLYQVEDAPEVEIDGVPYQIRDSVFIQEGKQRRIAVLWKRSNGQTMKVQIPVDEHGYEIAKQAIGRTKIRAKGTLIQRGSRWELRPSLPLEFADESQLTAWGETKGGPGTELEADLGEEIEIRHVELLGPED